MITELDITPRTENASSFKILFLDDEINRHHSFIRWIATQHTVDYCVTAKQAIERLKENTYDIAFLDHDLGGKTFVTEIEETGYEVVLNFNKINKPDLVIIHSFNPDGGKRMYDHVRLNYPHIQCLRSNFGSTQFIELVKNL